MADLHGTRGWQLERVAHHVGSLCAEGDSLIESLRRIALSGLTSAPRSLRTRLPPTLKEVAWDSGCLRKHYSRGSNLASGVRKIFAYCHFVVPTSFTRPQGMVGHNGVMAAAGERAPHLRDGV